MIRDSQGKWSIAPTIHWIASDWTNTLLYKLGMNALNRLTEELGETTMIAVPSTGHSVRVIGEVEGPGLLSVRTQWAGESITTLDSGFVR